MALDFSENESPAVDFAADQPKPIAVVSRSKKPITAIERATAFDPSPEHLSDRFQIKRVFEKLFVLWRTILQKECHLTTTLMDPRLRLFRIVDGVKCEQFFVLVYQEIYQLKLICAVGRSESLELASLICFIDQAKVSIHPLGVIVSQGTARRPVCDAKPFEFSSA